MTTEKNESIVSHQRRLQVPICLLALIGLALISSNALAFKTSEKIPVDQWTWIPSWSEDGRFVAVNWPAPARVGADGELSRVIGKPIERPKTVWTASPSTVNEMAKPIPSLIDNSEPKRTLILKFPSFELLPISLPDLRDVSWSPNGMMIAGKGQVFSTDSGRVLLSFNCQDEFAWSPDSKALAASHMTGIDVWNVETKAKLFSLPGLSAGMHCAIAWSPDGTKIAAAVARSNNTMQKTLLRVTAADGKELLSVDDKLGIENIGWSKDRNLFAYSDNALHILDGSTLKELQLLAPDVAGQVSFSWAPSGKLLAYKGEDETLHVFDVNKMCDVSTIQCEKTGRFQFKWSPDSAYLLVKALDQLAVCRASDGAYLGAKVFKGVSVANWQPDGKALVLSDFSDDSVSIEPVSFQTGEPLFDKGTTGNPWKDQKVLRTIDDCFEQLNQTLSSDYIKELKNTPEEKLFIYQGGPGLGMALRNTFGLRERNPLTVYFGKMGITDGASMSSMIIQSYWRHLNGRPLGIEEQASSYKSYEEKRQYIITDSKPLPNGLLTGDYTALNGETRTISKLPGAIKVISFVPAQGGRALSQLKAVASVRGKYSEKQVSMLVLKFSDSAIGGPDPSFRGLPSFSKEIKAIEEERKSSIYFGAGSAKLYGSLKDFLAGRFDHSSSGLPQTLIINKENMVVTRINGSVDERDISPIEDAVDLAMQADHAL